MKHISRLTAIAIFGGSLLAYKALAFVRCVLLKVYMDLGGSEPCLPSATVFAVKATASVSLLVISSLGLLALGASEFFLRSERSRFIVQIVYLTALILFLAFALSAFVLPMYIPETIIR